VTEPTSGGGAGASRELHISGTTLAGMAGLTIGGEVDLGSSGRLMAALDAAIRESAGPFVVDLSGLAFLDSSVIHALLRARALLGREERRLVVVCPPGAVHKIFEVVGILDLLMPFASRDDAVRALGREATRRP
jgi:anti-sigma B factor antagonist